MDNDQIERLKEQWEQQAKNKKEQPCPTCGRCPTCGHGPRDAAPLPYVPYVPTYPPYQPDPIWIVPTPPTIRWFYQGGQITSTTVTT